MSKLPPPAFLAKMESLLGADYAAFAQSYQEASQRGLRVNTLKIAPADFISKVPFALTPVGAYEPAGFRLEEDCQPGRHPFHAAGLYYLQEPSAMAAAALLQPEPGDLVLDLAAAPGGKATHLVTLMQDQGLLVANDVHRGRAKILAENLERWGARHVMVTNNQPEQLARTFGSIFDKVLVDAPCSGEGMFRKQGGFAWGEEMVAACSRRQSAVLETAVSLVRPGGMLAYATCTFSPEEDEQVVARFLAAHPQFSLCQPPAYVGFQSGEPAWADGNPDLSRAVRLWPHHFQGEGHFIALFQHQGEPSIAALPRSHKKPHMFPTRAQRQLWQDFEREHLNVSWEDERLQVVNGRYLILPPAIQLPTQGLHLLRLGLNLGELRQNHFKPAHALALALIPDEIKQSANFSPTSP
ncbi:MAG: SAM-dependent methyltransferase, partial [Chloroflexi bacterium]